MRTLKLTLAYDGSGFEGWQFQPGKRTVQGVLEAALDRVVGLSARTLASSRTDAGVHALEQVVSARTMSDLDPESVRRAVNAMLPSDVVVLKVEEAAQDFHPIRDVESKRYVYLIYDGQLRPVFWRKYCWHFRGRRLEAAAMHRAAEWLRGTHDFSSFEASGAKRASAVRTIDRLSVQRAELEKGRAGGLPIGPPVPLGPTESGDHVPPASFVSPGAQPGAKPDLSGLPIRGPVDNPEDPATIFAPSPARLEPSGNWIIVEVEADGFLYKMVRSIVGTLVEVGRGKRPESWPGEVLRAQDRRAAGPTAPPEGLFLANIRFRGNTRSARGVP